MKLIELLGLYYFGGGNLFVFFLCLVILFFYKDYCMNKEMDYNVFVMYFDKLVRKYDFYKILMKVRVLYIDYLSLCGVEKDDEIFIFEEIILFWCS